ncbi:MAG: hypothetical protein ACD_58C00342G0003 [uncultured bacterium]|nr:MAG: hypothetical protein ACD_58C00342G0003 [uncultured bacterium]
MGRIVILLTVLLMVGFMAQAEAKEQTGYSIDQVGDQTKIFLSSSQYQSVP